MSQPFDRSAVCEAPAAPDEKLGEFWEPYAWNIAARHNLSAFERNRTFLNMRGTGFLDLSHVSGADIDGDSRSAVAADFDNDGRIDLAVRQVGGGPLKIFHNQFPKRHYLDVSLHGVESNRQGIGSRVTAYLGDRQIVREMYPINSFHSQAASRLHFGLGDEEQIDKLVIEWPSGSKQVLRDVSVDRHIVIEEGHDEIRTVVPGEPLVP